MRKSWSADTQVGSALVLLPVVVVVAAAFALSIYVCIYFLSYVLTDHCVCVSTEKIHLQQSVR